MTTSTRFPMATLPSLAPMAARCRRLLAMTSSCPIEVPPMMIPIHSEPDATADEIHDLLMSHTTQLQAAFEAQLAQALDEMSRQVLTLLAESERHRHITH